MLRRFLGMCKPSWRHTDWGNTFLRAVLRYRWVRAVCTVTMHVIMLRRMLQDLDDAWHNLLISEAERSRAINAQIRQWVKVWLLSRLLIWSLSLSRIKESLRKAFADLANDFEKRLRLISSELTAVEGPLEVCSDHVRAQIPTLNFL